LQYDAQLSDALRSTMRVGGLCPLPTWKWLGRSGIDGRYPL